MAITLPIHSTTTPTRHTLGDSASAFWYKRAEVLDKWVVAFAILAPFTNIPQLLKIFTEQKSDLSVLSWSLYLLFNIPFIVHGLIRNDKVVLFNAGLNMVMQAGVLIGIAFYG